MPHPPEGVIPDALRRQQEQRHDAVVRAWQRVRLDRTVIAAVRPLPDATSRRGCPLPMDAPEWYIHVDALTNRLLRLPGVRFWYPALALPSLDATPAQYGGGIATAAWLYCREQCGSSSGSHAYAVLNAFVLLSRYAATVGQWGDGVGALSLFHRHHLNAFARWCETATPGGPDRHPGIIISFIRWAEHHTVPGFTRAMVRATRDVYVRTVVAGHIARIGHPTRGTLVEQERQALLGSIAQPHPGHDPLDRALVRLCWEIGLRPTQIAALTWGMLRRSDKRDATPYIRVPRAKRGRSGQERTYSDRTLSLGLYEMLEAQRPADAAADDLIFARDRTVNERLRRWCRLHDLATTRPPARSRRTRKTRRSRVRDGIRVWPLRLTAYRLRRTLATRLSEAGAGAQTIVAALDDDTLAMATIYAANSATLVDALRDTLDRHPQWVRVLKLFAGEIGRDDALRLPVIPGGALNLVRPVEHARAIGVIGRCRKAAPCNLYPPLDCYTCKWFEAEADPMIHRRQLEQIVDELDAKVGTESDRMAVIFKRAGLAISELVAHLERHAAKTTERVVAAQQRRMVGDT
jgi:Phage integrase family.